MCPFHKVNLTWKVPKEIQKWFQTTRQRRERKFLKICEGTRFSLLLHLPLLRTVTKKERRQRAAEEKKNRKTFIDTTLEPLFFSFISLSGRLDDAKDISSRKSNYTPSHALVVLGSLRRETKGIRRIHQTPTWEVAFDMPWVFNG